MPLPNVLDRYTESDIVVLPVIIGCDGDRDITPNVVIEAMAMQRPVISTHVAAILEIIEDEVSGMLVPSRDKNASADAIVRLIDDPGLREEIGHNARERVEERFNARKNIGHFVTLYGNGEQNLDGEK